MTPLLDLNGLRRVAEAATQGEWTELPPEVSPDGEFLVTGGSGGEHGLVAACTEQPDALHIATFDPPTALTLLNAVDKSQTEIVRLLDVVRRFEARAEAAEQAIEQARREEREKCEAAIVALYDRKKAEGLPHTTPQVSPSKSHYRERRQGFLSGLLTAIETIRPQAT